MAGTDRSLQAALAGLRPAIILVNPQLGENIGAAARAMLNFGLDELRLVNPRDGWPNTAATATAAGADRVLQQAEVFDSLEAALADRRFVLATTARTRGMALHVVAPPEAASLLRQAAARGDTGAVVFGRESTGLDNDSLALADAAVSFPANPGFSSLNLAMAVLLIAWEWQRADPPITVNPSACTATKADLLGFFEHLEGELDKCGFFRTDEMRPGMVRNLRTLFQRARLSEQEVRTLRGVVSGLAGPNRRR